MSFPFSLALIWPLSLLCSGGVTSAAHPVPANAPKTTGLRAELPSARPLEASDRETGLRSQTHLPCESELLYDSQTISPSPPCLSLLPPQHCLWANSIYIFSVMNIQILIHSKSTSIFKHTIHLHSLWLVSPSSNKLLHSPVSRGLSRSKMHSGVCTQRKHKQAHTHTYTHVNTPHANTTIFQTEACVIASGTGSQVYIDCCGCSPRCLKDVWCRDACGFALFPTALTIAFATETRIAQWVLFHNSWELEFSHMHKLFIYL